MAEVTVGVDIGTTSVKALAVDGDGRIVERARVVHGVRAPAADLFEHDVERAWRAGVLEAYRQVAGDHRVAGVEVAAMVPSMCAVDETGTAVTPGLLYGDARGRGAVTDETDPSNPSSSAEFVGFARWCAQTAGPGARLWPAQAVANHALTGSAAIDTTSAFMAYPFFDGMQWDPDRCAAAGLAPEQLPAVLPSASAVGTVGNAPVGAGTIDAYAEQIAAGPLEVGDVLVICGTTLIVWLVTAEPIEVPGLWMVPSLSHGAAMTGGASNAGGLFLEWAKRFGGGTDGSWTAAPPADDPGAVPVWLPYLRGERTPLHDPHRRAAMVGLDLTHGPAQLRRAAYEASAFVARRHVELAGAPARRIVATGGGVRDGEWMQALADVTGLPVEAVAVPEGAAYGAAFMARVLAGLEEREADAARWASIGHRIDPRAAWTAAAQERYDRFVTLTVTPP